MTTTSNVTATTRWKLGAISLGAWLVVSLLGAILLPSGVFRDWLWPTVSAAAVLVVVRLLATRAGLPLNRPG